MKFIEYTFKAMLVAAAVCFLLAALLTFSDVVLRAVASKSIPAGVEITALLIGLGAVLSIPHCYATNSHVTAKLLSEFFPKVLGRPLFIIGSIGSIIFATAMFGTMAVNTYEKLGSAETTPDAGLRIYVLLIVVSIGFLISLIGSFLGSGKTPKNKVDHG